MNPDDKITYFAETDFRSKKTRFGIKAKDRGRHVYVIGKTGMGKSTLLENMAVQDILSGEGMAFIDPHGGTAEKLLDYIPPERIKDVVYFAPFDLENPVSLNVLEDIGFDKRHLVASGLMSTFKKIWVDAWSARMEYILNNTLLALLEYPDATLLGVNRMLAEKDFRNAVVANVKDPSVKAFWVEEFAKFSASYMQEAGAAIQNKIGQFTANPIIRNIIGQPKSSFDVRKLMDEKKILIMNLSKGQIGEQNASLLGGMLITKIYLAAMSRADVAPREREALPPFFFFVDEFQSFANATFADILSEARKYKLNLTIAHQYIEQMEEEVRDAVFGNVGTTIAFRVGPFDAEVLEKIFLPTFNKEDIVNLGFAQIYLTLMVDGIGTRPFSATTLGPIKEPAVSSKEQVLAMSRQQFGKPRAEVQERISKWFEPVTAAAKPRTDFPSKEGAPTGAKPFADNRAPRSFDKPMQNAPCADFKQAPQREYPPRQAASAPRDESYRRDAPKPKVEEKKPFANLKDMLSALESGEAQEVKPPQAVEQKPVPAPKPPFVRRPESARSQAPRPPEQSSAMQRPVSLDALKKAGPAPTANLSTLKDALASALKDKPTVAPAPVSRPQPVPVPAPTLKEQRTEDILLDATASPQPQPTPHVPQGKQEVSEDVLKKILE